MKLNSLYLELHRPDNQTNNNFGLGTSRNSLPASSRFVYYISAKAVMRKKTWEEIIVLPGLFRL